MRDSRLKTKHCLNSISFNILEVIIYISEFISAIMNILLLIITSWKYLKSTIKILNFVCLGVIVITSLINILMFRTKNIKKEIFLKYTKKTVTPIFLIILYIIIIAFNVYNAIYLSIKLHIADYPEYGGRKRDQDYINAHPDEFGNILLKEFIIVAVCPSIICVLNGLCIIISIMFRQKIILIYNKAYEELYSKDKKVHKKNKEKNKNKNDKKSRNSTIIIRSADDLVNSSPKDDNNNKDDKDNKEDIIQIKINDEDNNLEGEIKLPKKFKNGNFRFDSSNTLNEDHSNDIKEIKEYNKELPEKFFFGGKEIKTSEENKNGGNSLSYQSKILMNSLQGSKTTMGLQKSK